MDGGRTVASTGWRPASGLPAGDLVAIERALGWRPAVARPATLARGEADTAARWIVADGSTGTRSAFVKVGATSLTARNGAPTLLAVGEGGVLVARSGNDWPTRALDVSEVAFAG